LPLLKFQPSYFVQKNFNCLIERLCQFLRLHRDDGRQTNTYRSLEERYR